MKEYQITDLLDKYNFSGFEQFNKTDFQRTNLCFPDLVSTIFYYRYSNPKVMPTKKANMIEDKLCLFLNHKSSCKISALKCLFSSACFLKSIS